MIVSEILTEEIDLNPYPSCEHILSVVIRRHRCSSMANRGIVGFESISGYGPL